MKNIELKQLINYLKTHPTAARELAEALEQSRIGNENSNSTMVDRQSSIFTHSETPGEVHAEVCWITAVEMGRRVGMSAKWVKQKVDLLPKGSTKHGSRRKWLIDERMTNNLTQYK